jgi:Kef-type K+ transport system membrane component KefB
VSLVILAAEGAGTLPGAETLILIGIGAFTLPLVGRRFGMPAVVLEIVFGLVLGPEVLAIVEQGTQDFEFVELLAELGLLLLMFLAGFEVDFERLERQGPRPVLFGVFVYVLILVAAWVGLAVLSPESTNQRIFLTLLLSAASLGIIIPALRGTGRSSTSLGQAVFVTGVSAEFTSATAIVIFGVWIQNGFGWRLAQVPLLFGILAAMLFVVRWLAWWYPERFERLFAKHDPDEIGIRASLALLFVFVGISIALNVEPILGAFLAGALFAYVFRNTGDLESRLGAFAYGFFIPVFFISVGLNFPLSALYDMDVLTKALLLVAVAVLAKVIPSIAFRLRGMSMRESVAAGVLLAGQLSVIIALAEFGRTELGVIDEGLEAGAVLLVGVTAILSPIVFRLLAPALPGTADVATGSDDEAA